MVWKSAIEDQNLWWKHNINFKSYDKDLVELSKELIKFERKKIKFEKGKIYFIRGPRRVGKTVWIKQSILKLLEKVKPEQIFYLNCETLPSRSKEQLDKTIKIFLDSARDYESSYLFLDEVTYINDWQIELKSLYDLGLLKNSAVLVTGSVSSALKNSIEYMPGRGVEENEYLLKPLSFRAFVLQIAKNAKRIINGAFLGKLIIKDIEFVDALESLSKVLAEVNLTLEEDEEIIKKALFKIQPFVKELKALFDIYLLTGGFPKVINNYLKNSKEGTKIIDNALYEEMINYILGDITKLHKEREIARQVLTAILSKLGSRYSFTALSKEIESIERPTLVTYLDVLENSFIVYKLLPFDFNKKKASYGKSKKVYFSDPFIFHSINSIISGKNAFDAAKDYLKDESNLGRFVEDIILTHLASIKEIPKMKESSTFLWFYYDRKKEIDAIYKKENDEFIGIEIKYQFSSKKGKNYLPIKSFFWITKENFDPKNFIMPVPLFLSFLPFSEKNL